MQKAGSAVEALAIEAGPDAAVPRKARAVKKIAGEAAATTPVTRKVAPTPSSRTRATSVAKTKPPSEPSSEALESGPVLPRPRKPAKQGTVAALTESMMEALAAAGGADYLLAIARDDPKTFCALLTRILPVRGEAGKAESGIMLRWEGSTLRKIGKGGNGE
jgi:hypothetical protein